jgi:hypothetical protein
MTKFAIGLLTLAMYAASLVVVPMVTPAKAVTNSSKEIKKKKRISRSPGIVNAKSSDPSANPFSSDMYDDFDRKNAGGGGGY